MELCKSLLRRVDSFKNCPLVGRGAKRWGGGGGHRGGKEVGGGA